VAAQVTKAGLAREHSQFADDRLGPSSRNWRCPRRSTRWPCGPLMWMKTPSRKHHSQSRFGRFTVTEPRRPGSGLRLGL